MRQPRWRDSHLADTRPVKWATWERTAVDAPKTMTKGRPLAVGLLLPDHEGHFGGATARWRDLREMALLAEAIGVDSLWVTDHLINVKPHRPNRGTWECWSHLSALAAITERVALGTLVICTGFRNPALLAKMAATVEEISDGRLILGLGAGWNEAEHLAFGYPFDRRVSRFAEALTIITGLLRDGQIDFCGEFYQARDCELRPRGPRPERTAHPDWLDRAAHARPVGALRRRLERLVHADGEQRGRLAAAAGQG